MPVVVNRQPPIEILPIQIRPDLTVQIAGIPHDLTREEAEKIARVVLAMATPDEVADDSECFRVRRPYFGEREWREDEQ